MNNLITEARELCEKATPGPWEWTVSDDFGSEIEAENLKGVIGLEDDYPGYPECGEHLIMNLSKADAAFIARSRTIIPELCDALEKANEQIESIHKSLDFAETQRQRSKNYTELAVNNGLALGRIAVTLQHDFETLPAQPEKGAQHEQDRTGN